MRRRDEHSSTSSGGPRAPFAPGNEADLRTEQGNSPGAEPPSARTRERADANPAASGTPESLLPAIAPPKGGGALRGLGERFSVNASVGTASLSVPLPLTPGRGGAVPEVALTYASGAGNGPFGIGFQLSVPSITRKTEQGLPRYLDAAESDTYVLSGADDLVPWLDEDGEHSFVERTSHRAYRYRPRVEGAFSRIERWVAHAGGDVHWRVTTKENVTYIYGESAAARIADPAAPAHVFSWLVERVLDDRGNITRYEYKAEDGAGVDPNRLSERTRFDTRPPPRRFLATAQKYLKRVRYANARPDVDDDYLLELVFDYGEHGAQPDVAEEQPWTVRADAFSSYRAGFEVRTYRLCSRVLMFHRTNETRAPLLVRALEFAYDAQPGLAYLTAVTQVGYLQDPITGIWSRELSPTLRLDYQRAEIHDRAQALSPRSIEGLSGGTGSAKTWLDLDGEGIPGVLVKDTSGWYYKENLGDGELYPPRSLRLQPHWGALAADAGKLEDINGDGRLEYTSYDAPLSGYFERTPSGGFEPLRPFTALPRIDWNDPNLRFIDLDGDGLGDLLLTEEQALVWYRSRGKAGFEPSIRVPVPADEDRGPHVVFADREQSIFLADMSGDGLVDIVRVQNGQVSYWPNLGHGRFGAKVTLENSPVFANAAEFSAARVRLSDIDGSGTSDVIYSGHEGTTIYLNQAGNRLSPGTRIRSLPPVDSVTQLDVVDLLGTGTSCLVWSSPLGLPNRTVVYVDPMNGEKPHLLRSVDNGLGASFTVSYAPSTRFYLEDKKNGERWLTRLPFPVQVVERTERRDAISGSVFVSRYRYKHGFFDGVEREFRGFARVEQIDAESFSGDVVAAQPPVRTVSWYHTGAWLEKERLELGLQAEYYAGGGSAVLLPRAELPASASVHDARESARALKGSLLRQEVYADDGSAASTVPYVITEQTQEVRMLQPSRGASHPGVFFVVGRESVVVSSERAPSDFRVKHDLNLEVDPFGNVEASFSIAYGRPGGDPEQRTAAVVLNESRYTNQDRENLFYRLGTLVEQRSYEVTGLPGLTGGTHLVTRDALRTALASLRASAALDFEQEPDAGQLQRRLISHTQRTFYTDTLSGEAPLGEVGLRAVPYRSYQLAFTPGIVTALGADALALGGEPFDPALLGTVAGYVARAGGYWKPSGRLEHDPAHFYLATSAIDPFGQRASVGYDRFDLLVEVTRDALGNETTAEFDYRVFAPRLVTDANLNRTQVDYDALGRVARAIIMGKAGETLGDTPEHPTTTFSYDTLRWEREQKPAYVHSIRRERHVSDLLESPLQHRFTYSDGFGRVVQEKVQAEPGQAPFYEDGVLQRNPDGSVRTRHADERWVATGRTVFNNKGNPVKRYEPLFSSTSDFEAETDLVQWGVTPIVHYDALDRVVRTEYPDGSEARVQFEPWRQISFDRNDAVLGTRWLSEHQSGTADEQLAAALTLAHADTPLVTELDVLGRAYLDVAHNRINGVDSFQRSRRVFDIQGNVRRVIDARQQRRNPTSPLPTRTQTFDLLGRRIRQDSADAGTRLQLLDVHGKLLRSWDSRGHRTSTRYDALERPTHVVVRAAGRDTLVMRAFYGESLEPALARSFNLRGQTYAMLDGAGLTVSDRFDFAGRLLAARRRLATSYEQVPDYTAVAEPADVTTLEATAIAAGVLEPGEAFSTRAEYDALGRVTRSITPDGSVTRHVYNRAALLEQLHVSVRGEPERAAIVAVEYNARGQRVACTYGNGTESTYRYDPATFRLALLETRRASPSAVLQRVTYQYDPVGNVLLMRNGADTEPFFNGAVTSGDGLYTYDALYRLISATGREYPSPQPSAGEPQLGAAIPHPNDTQALARYSELYSYDEVDNLTRVQHTGAVGWTRHYQYEEHNDRLIGSSANGDPEGTFSERYEYATGVGNNAGAHGAMTRMPHLFELIWDYGDRLQQVDKQGGGRVYFAYGSSGQRSRKVWVHNGIVEERIYLGAFEIYRRRAGSTLELERETLHVFDEGLRIAMAETVTAGPGSGTGATARWRFQLDDHLGSALLELDHMGRVISYEEYHPYGSTAFHAAAAGTEVSRKRYRYTGKERDEETGLYYHGARYYAAWLGKWTSADPILLTQPERADTSAYAYARGSPITATDPTGLDDERAAALGEAAGKAARASSARVEVTEHLKKIGVVFDPVDPNNSKVQRFTYKAGDRTVEGFLIAGETRDTAFIYGGIHGNERRGKEIGRRTVDELRTGPTPPFTVIVVPDVVGRRADGKEHLQRNLRPGVDPNRQFLVAEPATEKKPAISPSITDARQNEQGDLVDQRGQRVDPVNVRVQQLREALMPERILQLHGIHNPAQVGVYSDARVGLGSEAENADHALAEAMSAEAKQSGAAVPGNVLTAADQRKRTRGTVYPNQGQVESDVKAIPGRASAGTAFSRPVVRSDGVVVPAANVVLIETSMRAPPRPGQPDVEVDAFVKSILNVFLR